MPFELQPFHLLLIIGVALLIFGPRRLPEIGRGLGRAINEFRQGTQELTANLRSEMDQPVSAAAGPVPPHDPEPVSGNFCIHCGVPNPAVARFCNQCSAQMPG